MNCKEPGCKSNFACADQGSPRYSYCFRHAQKNGLVSKEETSAFEEKRSKAIKDSWKSGTYGKRESKVQIRKDRVAAAKNAKTKEQLEEERRRDAEEAQDLIHKILGDQNFDAGEMVRELRVAGGTEFRVMPHVRKFIFMQWFLSDPKTRKPSNLYELTKILEMTINDGREWMESDWFVSDLQGSMQKNMKLAMPYLARVVLGKALQGDFNAVKEFLKVFGKHEKKEGETDWNDIFDEDILKEAGEVGVAEN